MPLNEADHQHAKDTLRLLAELGVHPTLDQLIDDALDEQLNDEPFVAGLQRVENIYLSAVVGDHWNVPRERGRRMQVFHSASPVRFVAANIMSRACRVLLADPAKPNRIIFDHYPRPANGLKQFVELHQLVSNARSVVDFYKARNTELWPIVRPMLVES